MIYTFYSYQGGVGRSMALASVARWLYEQGLRIVIVDWNLQSPGLESFFFQHQNEGAETEASVSRSIAWVQDQLGVMDMLVDYQQSFGWLPGAAAPETDGKSELAPRERMPLAEYLVPIHPGLQSASGQRGSLYLLTAGRRSQEYFESYAQAVADFSWDNFEADFRGKEYLDSLRRELLESADVVLIDGPTGVGGVGGVCTRLPDVVICFSAPDDQNVDGTARMLEHFRRARPLASRHRRPLETSVVPARVDHSGSERARASTLVSHLAELAPEGHALRRLPRSPPSEPASVPPVASPTAAVRRAPGKRRWLVAGLSLVVVCTGLYLAARALPQLASAARGVSPLPTHEETDLGTSETTAAQRPDPPDKPPELYLRIGLGPSCPKMLAYRKQFRAAGMADAEVAELRSGGCALLLGPYPPETVERRRKEHNARRISGFGNAIVVDARDFDKLL